MAYGKKTGGRQIGSINKASFAIKDAIKNVVSEYMDGQVWDDLEEVDPATRLNAITKLAAFVTPKERDINLKTDNKPKVGGIMGYVGGMTAKEIIAKYPHLLKTAEDAEFIVDDVRNDYQKSLNEGSAKED